MTAATGLAAAFRDGSRPPVGRAGLLGLLVVLLFVGGFAAWAAIAPLQSAAVAPGSVIVETSSKTVQHLEGGLVKAIHVREGDLVEAGEVLIELDETQAKSRIAVLSSQIESETEQLTYLAQEIADIEGLVAKGLATKPRLLALYRRQVELEGAKRQHEAELIAARDIVLRSMVRAPIDGKVVGLQVHTPGGVIGPGEVLMTVVPQDDVLMVEARLDPNDIDVVHQGLDAQVRLTPYSARHVPPVEGHVVWVSADRFTDEATGMSYYLARIRLEAVSDLAEDVTLYPGMPVEAMIVTGERTFLDYLLDPVLRSFRRAFREG